MNEKFSPNYYIVRFTEYEMVDTVKGYTSKREASIHIFISFPVLCANFAILWDFAAFSNILLETIVTNLLSQLAPVYRYWTKLRQGYFGISL